MINPAEYQSQNLIKQVREASTFREPAFYKPLIFDAMAVLLAAASSYFYKGYLDGVYGFAPLLVAVGIFMIFYALRALLPRRAGRRFFVSLLQSLAFISFFYKESPTALALSALMALILLWWGESGTQKEFGNSLEMHFFKATRPAFQRLTTTLVFLGLILYLPNFNEGSVLMSQPVFQGFYGSTAGFVSKYFYPEVNFNASVYGFAEGIARYDLNSSDVFKNMPPAEQKTVLDQATNQVLANIGKTVGVVVKPTDQISSVVYELLLKTLDGWFVHFGYLFIVGWSLVVFAIWRSLGTLFYWLVSILAFFVYEMFISLGVVRVTGESRVHEIIEY